MLESLQWVVLLSFVIAVVLLLAAVSAFWRRRPLSTALRFLAALAVAALGIALGAIALGTEGYRALTREEIAATVRIQPVGPKRFRAQFRFSSGGDVLYLLNGDELYVDARILKWHPLANFLGLHTVYELDRVAGRYLDLEEERRNTRTLYGLARERPFDLFNLRRRYVLLAPLLDAEYGSATFAAADAPANYEIRISTTGLLVRRLEPVP